MSSLKCWLSKLQKQNKICKEDLNEIFNRLDGHDKAIRDKTFDEIIYTLAESEDTILTDKQYYKLIELKGERK